MLMSDQYFENYLKAYHTAYRDEKRQQAYDAAYETRQKKQEKARQELRRQNRETDDHNRQVLAANQLEAEQMQKSDEAFDLGYRHGYHGQIAKSGQVAESEKRRYGQGYQYGARDHDRERANDLRDRFRDDRSRDGRETDDPDLER